MIRRLHAPAGATLLLLSVSRSLPAAEPPSPSPASEHDVASKTGDLTPARRAELAREQGHLGLAAYAEQRFRDALDHFVAAEGFMHSPVFTLYLARCHEALGELERARAYLVDLTAEQLPPNAPVAWHEAQASAKSALSELDTASGPPNDTSDSPAAPDATSSSGAPDPAPPSVARPLPGELFRPASPRAEARPYRYGAYAAFGVGLLGLATGAAAGGMAYAKARDLRARCDGNRCLASDAPQAYDARRLAHVATAGFVVAATGAAAGLTLWLLPSPSAQREVMLVLSPTAATVQGRF